MRKKTTNKIPNGDLGGLRGDACPPYPEVKRISEKCNEKGDDNNRERTA
jgi:hypothetical protein